MKFSRQEYWSGVPFPPPGHLPGPGIKPKSLASPALAGGFFSTSTTWEAPCTSYPLACLPSDTLSAITPETPHFRFRACWSLFLHCSAPRHLHHLSVHLLQVILRLSHKLQSQDSLSSPSALLFLRTLDTSQTIYNFILSFPSNSSPTQHWLRISFFLPLVISLIFRTVSGCGRLSENAG